MTTLVLVYPRVRTRVGRRVHTLGLRVRSKVSEAKLKSE